MADQPTTVRGWLETLPEPLRTKAISQCLCYQTDADSVSLAIQRFAVWEETEEGHFFWAGVQHYIEGYGHEQLVREIGGYNAAKAAYGAKEPTTVLEVINTLPDWSPDAEPSLKSRMTSVCSHFWNEAADDLLSVTKKITSERMVDVYSELFWEGVKQYFDGVPEGFRFVATSDGYELAKATMEFAKRQETESTNGKETPFDPEEIRAAGQKLLAYDVAYVAESPKTEAIVTPFRLSELEQKAAAFDKIRSLWARLCDEFEEMKAIMNGYEQS